MKERRQILAIVLMFLVLAIYQIFYVERFQRKRPRVRKPPATTDVTRKAPEKPPAPLPPISEVEPLRPSPGAREKTVRVLTNLYEVTFSTRGATLTSWKLKKYPLVPGNDAKGLVDLVPAGERALLVAFDDPAMRRASTEGIYSASVDRLDLSRTASSGELSFTYAGPKGSQIVKRFIFHNDKYAFSFDLFVRRPDGSTMPLDHRVLWAYGLGGGNAGYGDYTTVSHLIGEKRVKDKPGKLPPLAIHKGPVAWSAIQTKYFAAILAPRSGTPAAAVAKRTRKKAVTKTTWTFQKRTTIRKVSELAPAIAYAPTDDTTREQLLVFGGPKLPLRLKAYGTSLERVINYGWFGPISRPLLQGLRFLYKFVGNYGVAIILLTILIKMAFFPLSIKQQTNMRQMSKLQPRLKALQERYKNDKEKLNKEVMELYKREKVNPLGGCLPLLIQFPVIIALYRVLGDALELRGAPFMFWITDLSVPDSIFAPWFHVLPVMMGVTMLLQNHLSPASAMGGAGADPRQQQMFKYMPIIFLFIFWGFPAGLNLYWTVYTILGIAEQLFIKRRMAPQEAKAS